MSLDQPEFVTYAHNLFSKHGADYERIKEKLQKSKDKKNRLAELTHFYYFICRPGEDEDKVRDELRIVGITSLMEAMMESEEYQDVFTYFESSFPSKNSIENVTQFKKEYLSKHGSNRKIVKYFESYFSENDLEEFFESIKIWSQKKKSFIKFEKPEQLAKLLYQMRSDFVHKADMQSFRPKNVHLALIHVGGKWYDVRIEIKKVLEIFEKSLVKYWRELSE